MLVKELGQLLDADVTNQQGHGKVVEMRRLYFQDPAAFVGRYLIPVDAAGSSAAAIFGKGFFTLTTR
jgi:hypothetical protein